MAGFRKRDTDVEQEIARFMDEHFYPNHVTEFTRYTSREEQLKGKDVQFTYQSLKNIIVDEKAMSHYINRDLPTFAFELSFIRGNGEEVQGWFLDKSKETQYYLMMWIFAKQEKPWEVTKDDITRVDGILLDRFKLIEYLNGQGMTEVRMISRAREIRASGIDGATDKRDDTSYYFFNTTRLDEKPINIILKKRKLIELAEARFNVIP